MFAFPREVVVFLQQEGVTTACTRGFNIFCEVNFCCHLLASCVHFTVVKSQAILIIRLGVAEVIYHSSWGRRSYFRRNFISSTSFKTTKFPPRWICSGTTILGVFRPSANMLSIIMLGTCLCVHTQGWESETSFKLVYFEFVGLLYIKMQWK